MKRVGIDISFIDYFGHGEDVKVSSLVIFLTDILNEITARNLSDNYVLLCRFCDIDFLKQLFPSFTFAPLTPFESKLLYTISGHKKLGGKFFWKNSLYKKNIKKYDLSLLWFPFANYKNFIPSKIGIKKLLTVHDIYTYRLKAGKSFFDKIFTDNDNYFSTVSEYTKKDILNTLKYVPEDRITVIPSTVKISEVSPEVYNKEKNYILDINSYTERKNTITLLKAFYSISDKIDYDLVFIGGQKDERYYKSLISYVNENKLNDRVHFYFSIPEKEKFTLLKNASLFVNPSLFEGFGKTPVEAAIMKIPVITSKETSLYEVSKGLLNYYDNATDENELAEVILKVIADNTSDLQLIADKLKECYSPARITENYLSLFKMCLQ